MMIKQKMVRYFQDNIEIELGDIVETKIWFRNRRGKVVYVPGKSPFNKNMEYNGLKWVGIQIENGPFVANVIDPDSEILHKKVSFLRRNSATNLLQSEDDPFGDNANEEELLKE